MKNKLNLKGACARLGLSQRELFNRPEVPTTLSKPRATDGSTRTDSERRIASAEVLRQFVRKGEKNGVDLDSADVQKRLAIVLDCLNGHLRELNLQAEANEDIEARLRAQGQYQRPNYELDDILVGSHDRVDLDDPLLESSLEAIVIDSAQRTEALAAVREFLSSDAEDIQDEVADLERVLLRAGALPHSARVGRRDPPRVVGLIAGGPETHGTQRELMRAACYLRTKGVRVVFLPLELADASGAPNTTELYTCCWRPMIEVLDPISCPSASMLPRNIRGKLTSIIDLRSGPEPSWWLAEADARPCIRLAEGCEPDPDHLGPLQQVTSRWLLQEIARGHPPFSEGRHALYYRLLRSLASDRPGVSTLRVVEKALRQRLASPHPDHADWEALFRRLADFIPTRRRWKLGLVKIRTLIPLLALSSAIGAVCALGMKKNGVEPLGGFPNNRSAILAVLQGVESVQRDQLTVVTDIVTYGLIERPKFTHEYLEALNRHLDTCNLEAGSCVARRISFLFPSFEDRRAMRADQVRGRGGYGLSPKEVRTICQMWDVQHLAACENASKSSLDERLNLLMMLEEQESKRLCCSRARNPTCRQLKVGSPGLAFFMWDSGEDLVFSIANASDDHRSLSLKIRDVQVSKAMRNRMRKVDESHVEPVLCP